MSDKPAFPISTGYGEKVESASGLTKRELFAMSAMQGICAHPSNWGLSEPRIANMAVTMADALIKALEVGGE